MVYDEIMQSPAWHAIPHFAKALYMGIAAQFRGGNNGDLDFPVRKAKLYGISHKALAAGIPLLEQVGLIERTRLGCLTGGKKVCSLYALTCWPIDPSDKYDAPLAVQRPPSNAWARWDKPEEWSQIVRSAKHRSAGRKFQTPHVGNGSHPHVGNGADDFHSSRAEGWSPNSGPHVRYTSRDLGRGVQEQVEHLIAVHPHMSDIDVAVAFGWKISHFDVARIRQSFEGRSGASTQSREIPDSNNGQES